MLGSCAFSTFASSQRFDQSRDLRRLPRVEIVQRRSVSRNGSARRLLELNAANAGSAGSMQLQHAQEIAVE